MTKYTNHERERERVPYQTARESKINEVNTPFEKKDSVACPDPPRLTTITLPSNMLLQKKDGCHAIQLEVGGPL
jgi:hypothetical protein